MNWLDSLSFQSGHSSRTCFLVPPGKHDVHQSVSIPGKTSATILPGFTVKHFIIFNTEKEGSCALVNTLELFDQITIISDFIEPFDRHMFVNGPGARGQDISKKDFVRCLTLIYGGSENYLEELNSIYSRYRGNCPFTFHKGKHLGFKMRFRRNWKTEILSLLGDYQVTAFVLIRQDVLRWALSKYHGDGTGKKGHMQFSTVTIKDLPKIEVQWKLLKRQIERCDKRIEDRRKLLEDLRGSGIAAYPLYYEEFCTNKIDYFKNLLMKLDIVMSEQDIEQVLNRECLYKKVHPEALEEFIGNHEEILRRYEEYRSQKSRPRWYPKLGIPRFLRR